MKSVTCLGALVVLSSAAGCYSKGLCDYAECGSGGAVGSSSSSTTTTTSASSTMPSSSSTGVDPSCTPSAPAWTPSDTCGVFVRAGATGGDGKMGSPFGSLGDAIPASAGKPIYVCAAPDSLSEAVELTASTTLYGALDCTSWMPVPTKTAWTAANNQVPLTLRATANGSHVEGFAITAANASGSDGASRQGNSSIAVIADGVTATLVALELTAGDGAPGGDGMDYATQAPGRQSSAASFDGVMGGSCNADGGMSVSMDTCPTGGSSISGKGGDGDLALGSSGNPGVVDPGLGEPNGSGGLGEPNAGMWSCGAEGEGENGHDGPSGSPGTGGTGLGTVTASGYAGPTGGNGTNGTIAQGGGGGGGRKGNGANGCSAGQTGPSGGSGGAGGCGGFGAPGGGAGGASIALLSFNATLTTSDVKLVAKNGGRGGNGGDGQIGGAGGLGGVGGGGLACQGGNGGKGGDGGGGGGGKGGPSIGLAHVGAAPSIAETDITIAMVAASAGAAGGGNVPGMNGEAGLLEKIQAF